MYRNTAIITYIMTLLLIGNISHADIPQLISVQGRLTDTSDTPITTSTSYTFNIYNTPAAGTALWTEPHTIAPDENGIFTALLGSATPINIPFDEPYWLEVEIQGETLSPRYQMTSAPYALNALRSAGSLECNIYSVDTSCRNYYDNTYTWADMFPGAKEDGYEFKNCWPRTLPTAPLPTNEWAYSRCYPASDCSGSASGILKSNPSKTDTWNSELLSKCNSLRKYANPYPMDIICCKGGTSSPSLDSTISLECTIRSKRNGYSSSCLPGETLTGGGCTCNHDNLGSSRPSGNGWSCACPGVPGSIAKYIYAICCNVTGGGTSTEEKYCKRTTETYNGNLGGIVGANAKCQAEFGAGWSFVDTKEEITKILTVGAQLYYGFQNVGSPPIFNSHINSYDNMNISLAWFYNPMVSDTYSCNVYTSETFGNFGLYLTLNGDYHDGYTFRQWYGGCNVEQSIWCCPP